MKEKLPIVYAVLVFIAIFVMFSAVFKSDGNEIVKWRMSGGDCRGEAVSAPFSIAIHSPGLYTYEAEFPATKDDCLVIPRPLGYYLKVEVNGVCIGLRGSEATPTANIWNSVYDFPLPDSCKSQVNKIKITTYGIHDTGMPFVPYVADRETIGWRLDFQGILAQGLAVFMFGSYFTLIIFMLMLAYRTERYRFSYICFAISNLASLVYEFDILESRQLVSLDTFFIHRKIFLLAIYFCAFFLLLGLHYFFNSDKRPFVTVFLCAAPGVAVLFTPDFYWLQTIHGFGVLFLVATFIIFTAQNRGKVGSVLTFAFTIFFLCSAQCVGVMLIPLHQPLFFQIGLFVVFIGFAVTVSQKIILSEKEATHLKHKTMIDPLTGAFNRQYLNNIEMKADDCLVFFDIDRLKQINDVEGHSRGDAVIKEAAAAMMREIRSYDAVIRYGGDEFIVIFRRTASDVCRVRINAICESLKVREYPIELSWGMATYQGSLEATISLADSRMYEMKHRDDM